MTITRMKAAGCPYLVPYFSVKKNTPVLRASQWLLVLIMMVAAVGSSIQNASAIVPLGSQTIQITPVAEGLNSLLSGNTVNTRKQLIPIDMTPLGDGRQLVLTLSGHVRLLQADGTLVSGAYLDMYNSNSPPVVDVFGNPSDFRQIGNTSIAAHPGFNDLNSRGYGKFYVITSELPLDPGTADFDDGGNSVVDSVIHEWSIDPGAFNATSLTWTEGGAGDTVTRREVLRSARPGIIHTLVDMAFDSNENLIIASGDGGGNAFPNTDGVAFNQDRFTNAQDPSNIFGSVLRIDPLTTGPGDTRATGGKQNQYYIPADNFGVTDGDANTPGETFAFGVRSPFRVNIDTVTDNIYIGDVGENSREEVSLIVNGGNYGWGGLEGTHVHRADLVSATAIPPVWELYRDETRNVVGGFIYRGTELPGLQGMYIFAQTGEDVGSIDVYYGDPTTDGTSTRDDLNRFTIELPDGVNMPDRIWSMAEDENGELYLLVGPDRLDFFNLTAGETDGGIWRISAVPEPQGLLLMFMAIIGLLGSARRKRFRIFGR